MKRRTHKQTNVDFKILRTQFGGDSQFMNAHQIRKIRTRERDIPAWTLDDAEVQKVLLRAFPKWRTNLCQRQRAARWAFIITLYFRMEKSSRQVADELRERGWLTKPKNVELTVASIRRVARGYRADNTGSRGMRSPGRPKTQNVENKPLGAITVMHEGIQTPFS